MRSWKIYFLWFVVILLTEIFIAYFIRDSFIRPFVGDMLVVLLLYTLARTIINGREQRAQEIKNRTVALSVLAFAFCIEGLQATPLLQWFGLSENIWASTILGSTFDFWDLVAYSCGALMVFILEDIC